MSINFKNLKPRKKFAKGSESIIISTNNNNYVVKIYILSANDMISQIKIVNYLKKYNLPTIYKNYEFLNKKNSFGVFRKLQTSVKIMHKLPISTEPYKNNLPQYFSAAPSRACPGCGSAGVWSLRKTPYIDDKNLEELSKKYIMKNRLFGVFRKLQTPPEIMHKLPISGEIMKTYKMTLNDFLKIEKNNNIIESLYHQGLLTLLWLYMKKGILHKDISKDNFFVEETTDKYFIIKICNNEFTIKLYGYYLVLSDFGYSKSLELFKVDEYPNNPNSLFSGDMNPYYEILNFRDIFKKYINVKLEHIITPSSMYVCNINIPITSEYKALIKAYRMEEGFDEKLRKFKKKYYKFVVQNFLVDSQSDIS